MLISAAPLYVLRARVQVLLAFVTLLVLPVCTSFAQIPKSAGLPQLVVQRGHESRPGAMAISSDNGLLASMERGQVKLWNLRTGELLRSFMVDGSWTPYIAFSPDGKVVVPYVRFGKALIYDTDTGVLLRTLAHGSEPSAITFSPDGKTVALGGYSGTVSLWNYRTGHRLHGIRAHADSSAEAKVLAFSPDGTTLATSSSFAQGSPKLELWSVATGELTGSIEATDGICSAAFSPDGKTLALGVGQWLGPKPAVELWNVTSRKLEKRLMGHRFDIISLAFSKDGKTISSGDKQGILREWDVATGTSRHAVGEEAFHVTVAVSTDGTLGVAPDDDGALRVYDLTTGSLFRKLPGVPASTVAFALGNGANLVQAGVLSSKSKRNSLYAGQINVWDLRTGQWKDHLSAPDSDMGHIAVNTAGTFVVSAGQAGLLQVWNLRQRSVRILANDSKRRYIAMALSPDGSLVAVGGERKKDKPADAKPNPDQFRRPENDSDPLLELYSVQTGQLVRSFTGHKELVNAVQFSADGKTLLSCGYDSTVLMWDVKTGKLARTIDVKSGGNAPECTALSRDGRLAAVGYEYQPVGLFDTMTGKLIRSLPLPSQITNSIALSPNGRFVAAAGGDGILRIWEMSGGRLLQSMDAKNDYIEQVGFSPDSLSVTTLDGHGVLRVWNPLNGRLRATLLLFASNDEADIKMEWLACTPDGYYDGTPGIEKYLRWRVDGIVKSSTALYRGRSLRDTYFRPDLLQTALCGQVQSKLHDQIAVQEQALRERARRAYTEIRLAKEAATKPAPAPVTPADFLRKALSTGGWYANPPVMARIKAQIKTQLAAGGPLNTQGAYGTTALMFFCSAGDAEEVDNLLKQKADVNLVDIYGGTALTHATREGRDDLIQKLLDAGADLKDDAGKSLLPLRGNRALLSAALVRTLTSSNQFEVRKFQASETAYVLLYWGADPNARDSEGRTPLMLLGNWSLNDTPLFQALLTKGADVNVQSKDGDTILELASGKGEIAAVRKLLDRGAKVNIVPLPGTRRLRYGSALMAAASGGHPEVVKVLLERGANPNVKIEEKNDGRTALMFAVSGGHLEVVRLLLEHGVDVNARSEYDNWSALTYAAMRGDKTIVKLLIDKGADVHVRTKEGQTLLQHLKKYDAKDEFGIRALLQNAGAR